LPIISESNITYSYLTEEGIFTVCENQQQNLETFWNNFWSHYNGEKVATIERLLESNSPFLQIVLIREKSLV